MDEDRIKANAREYTNCMAITQPLVSWQVAIEYAFISGARLSEMRRTSENRLLDFVRSFIREWDAAWVDPDDINHEWAELYTEAKAIVKAAAVDTNEEE